MQTGSCSGSTIFVLMMVDKHFFFFFFLISSKSRAIKLVRVINLLNILFQISMSLPDNKNLISVLFDVKMKDVGKFSKFYPQK